MSLIDEQISGFKTSALGAFSDRTRIGANAVIAPGAILAPAAIVSRLALVDQGRQS